MYKICFYVPPSFANILKNNLFSKGAGKIGHYCCCSWETLGEGQFMPLFGSHPFVGRQDQLEKITELKIEMVCDDIYIQDVILELKKSHPYEEPAYQVWKLEHF